MSVHEEDVVQLVDRLEAQYQRRIAVLLQHHGCRQHRLETVGGLMAHNTAKAAERRLTGRGLGVVWQRVEEPLDIGRRVEPFDQPPFRRRTRQ